MQRTKPDKEVVAVDIDLKINSIETSIREIKQLLLGFQTSSYRHVNPETLKGTLQSILGSLQSPLNQISSFLEEVNGPNSKLNTSLTLPPNIAKKAAENEAQKAEATRLAAAEKAENARKEKEQQQKKEAEQKAKREEEEKTKREVEEKAKREAEEKAKREETERKAKREAEEKAKREAEERKLAEQQKKKAEEEAKEKLRQAEEEAQKQRREAEEAERVRRELEAAEQKRREAEEAEEAERRRHEEEEERQRQALADLAKSDDINVDGLSSDFDVSNLNFSTPAGDGDDFGDLNAAASKLDFGVGSSAADDLLAQLEGNDNQQQQSLSLDGLDFKTPNDEAADLQNALDSLGSAEQKTDLSDLLKSLDSGATNNDDGAEASSDEPISITDNFNFAPLPKKNKSSNARVIKRGARNALKSFNFEEGDFDENAGFDVSSLKRKGGKKGGDSSVAVDDLLSNLDQLSTPSTESDLASALNELSSMPSVKDDLLKSLGDLEATDVSLPTNFDDPIAASLKELEETQPATPDWMKMFLTGKEDSQPTDTASKRRSSRIERLTPLPQREVGQLFRGYGVREDINKAGLRRVKKGKGIHASGKPVLQMEDVNVVLHPYWSDSNKALFAVFDGHVGKNCAIAAKEMWPAEFITQMSASSSSNDFTQIFKTTYAVVDKRLSEYEYEGTTATTVYLWQDGEDRYLQAANVGDSTAFLCRDGEAIWLTKDHKVSDADEQERLKQLGPQAWHPGKSRINGLAVSRAMGDFFVKNEGLGLIGEPFVSPVYKIEPKDSILIVASDGLWDVISGQAAMNLIIHLDDAEEMAKTLIRHALNSPKCNDNITIIVVTL